MNESLTEEQKEYFISRCEENSYGKIIVSSRLVTKYREFSCDFNSHKEIIKAKIRNLYMWRSRK
jgi:hypothetical protein